MQDFATLRKLLPGIWFGSLACVALLATPVAFSALDGTSAGAFARLLFAREAPASLALGLLLLMLERRAALLRHEATGQSQFSLEMGLVLGAVFCTVAGYYGLQPMLEVARSARDAGDGARFGRLHLLSTVFFGAKGLLVLALAWRAAR